MGYPATRYDTEHDHRFREGETMKNIAPLCLLSLGLVLAACDITIDWGSGFSISNATYSTNFQDRSGGSYICDNTTTYLTYSFNYSGTLTSWTSYLKGENTGVVKGRTTFTPSSPYVDRYGNNYVEVTYTIPSGTAPLEATSQAAPQSIIVVPNPQVIGYSRLFLTVNGYSHPLLSNPIPVINGCS
jgi:hypothetical protein